MPYTQTAHYQLNSLVVLDAAIIGVHIIQRDYASMLVIIEPLQLQGWGGVDLMHLKANIKVLTSGQMGTFLVSRSDLDAHVDRLVEVRHLSGFGNLWYS